MSETEKLKKELSAIMPQGCKKSVIVASIRERIMFKDFQIQRGDFSINNTSPVEGNDSWDIIYTSGGTKCIGEIKIRDKKLSSWDHEGWIIEEYKYKALLEKQKEATAKGNLTEIKYINIFQDAIVIWDLNQTKPNFFERDSKSMTTESMGRKIKSVAYLTSNQGSIYKEDIMSPLKGIEKAEDIFYFMFPGEVMNKTK